MTTRLEAMIQRERAAATEWWSIDAENGVSVFVTRTGHPVATFVRPEYAQSAVRFRGDIPLLLAVVKSLKNDIAWEDARRAANPRGPIRIGQTTREAVAALDVEELP